MVLTGGIWYYSDNKRPNQGASSFYNLTTNTCKEMTCFSDFPFTDEYPEYMSHKWLHKYIHEYAAHFDLLRHIQFNTKVESVTRADDYDATGRWEVVVRRQGEEHSHTHVVDGVVLCSGTLKIPKMPDIPGLNNFTGLLLHMHDYRRMDIFQDKRVLVIG